MTQKIDFESQNLAHFDDFYSSDPKTLKWAGYWFWA